MKLMKWMVLGIAVLGMACSGGTSNGYSPPDLGSMSDALTISDMPVEEGGTANGRFPADGRYLGFMFQASQNEVLDITLTRLSGSDVPAEAIYRFADDTWSDALVWATADAESISIQGWNVPADGTYLLLVDVVSGDRTGTFRVTLSCSDGCSDPLECNANADCPAGMICWEGLCFESNVECQTNSDCHASEVCENGFCVQACTPAPEICDGMDNDCDGVVDEDCQQNPCSMDSDCAPYEVCVNGLCTVVCECATDADCPWGTVCTDCACQDDTCPDADGDGFSVCRGDCDDTNAAILPAANEICDRVDNDCDGIIDEGCGGLPCSSDSECPAGELCWDGVCIPACTCASDADCDDGDPATVDACMNCQCVHLSGCGQNADCPAGTACCAGVCADVGYDPWNCGACGQVCAIEEACVNGLCVAGCYAELCDGLDNDCDGEVDEGCGVLCSADSDCPANQVCVNGMCTSFDPCENVTCAAGQVCIDGVCIGCSSEICDGFDNDCDGVIDEGCGLPCASNSDCPAGQYCMNGLCIAYDPCENVSCAAGETCIDGVCVACGCQSDTDCDDGNPVTIDYCFNCQCTSDVCVDADADGYCAGEDCDDADSAVNPAAREICEDGMDNDCDGVVDEGCSLACASNSDCPAGMVCMNGVCVQG